MKWRVVALSLLLAQAAAARADDNGFTQFIGFGASNTDTGWFANDTTGIPSIDNAIDQSILLGGHASFNGPGPGNADILAARFGLDARPANTPGGTNYAIGGAFTHFGPASPYQNVFPNLALPGIVNQIGNYLSSHAGRADPHALYYISGTNSITAAISAYGNTPATQTYLDAQSAALTTALVDLQSAGAQHIIVGNIYYRISPDPVYRAFAQSYFTTTWNDLAAAGVRFIPSDLDSVILAVTQNMSAYGFTAPLASVACIPPAPSTGYGAWCAPTTTPNGVTGYLVSPNAQQTNLSLDFVHTTTAGQQIQADYNYNLLVAPGQASLIAESAVKMRANQVQAIERQLDAETADGVFDLWALGNWSTLEFDADRGFSTASGEGKGAAVGVTFRPANDVALGVVGGWSAHNPKFNLGGGFDIDETSGSVFAKFTPGNFSLLAIATYGGINVDLDRDLAVGLTTQKNRAETNGTNASLALLATYGIVNDNLRHGPIAGLVLQSAEIDGFTESGSYTSLSFAEQERESQVSRLGYQATLDLGSIAPFAQIEWAHEFAGSRDVVASLTTVVAPSYSMPATIPSADWGTATMGAGLDLGGAMRGQVSVTAQFDEAASATYFANVGLHYAIPPR